jgi:hypothetical protein
MPTLKLRLPGIDHQLTLDKYLRGGFQSLTRDQVRQLWSFSPVAQRGVSTEDQTQPQYRFRDKNNWLVMVAHGAVYSTHPWSPVASSASGGSMSPPRCGWCRRDILTTPVGRPVNYVLADHEHQFWMVDSYSHFGCAYADILRLGNNSRDSEAYQSECWLKLLFELAWPGHQLVPAPHYSLLQDNGGPLTPEQFYSGQYIYRPGTFTAYAARMPYTRQEA